MAGTLTCECGREGLNNGTLKMHQRGKKCQEARGISLLVGDSMEDSAPYIPGEGGSCLVKELYVKIDPGLDADLQSILDDIDGDPRLRAKATRFAFSARNWPNNQHPGNVRDFLKEHKIPIIDTPRHTAAFEVSQYMQKRVEEIRDGQD